MSRPFIDPIPVHEEKARLAHHAAVIAAGLRAADALMWFSEYGADGEILRPIKAEVEASSTPRAEAAQAYLTAAAQGVSHAIVEAAIKTAQHDFDLAKAARLPKEKAR